MIPAVAFVSLAWALACLLCTSEGVTVASKDFSCMTFKPSDSSAAGNPQIMPSPFKIEVEQDYYHKSRHSSVIVKLVATGGHTFHSFILGAYIYQAKRSSFDRPVGELELLDTTEYSVHERCRATYGSNAEGAFALRSTDTKAKRQLRFKWTSNSVTAGHIEFRASFIEADKSYWVAEQSVPVRDLSDNTKLPRRTQAIPRIDTSECGAVKGCFREPAGCEETQCLYVLTWRPKPNSNTEMEFELGGLADTSSDRYVAVGISDDKYMGDDNVFTCAHNSAKDTTEVYISYNQIDPKRNTPIRKYDDDTTRAASKYDGIIIEEEGSYTSARLRCRFTVKRDLDTMQQIKPKMRALRGEPQYLLFANGFASRGVPSKPWLRYMELPGASEGRVDLGSVTGDHSGWASFPLAKAHGILMIIAWILCASVGLLLTKYYKPMWPNSDWFGSKYWFFGHVNCMAMVFIITIIAVILIFVETGHYSQAPDLPQKAHPILGIIILICVIINPIIALIRPGEGASCRPVFNWFHWAFGTIANVLAIPTIFIGMDFGKVMVPWWATWVLVIWVIFHIIVELTLEVHQCCTHKKNKERRKKHELMKRENKKSHHDEPQPVGYKFKRFMLSLHVCVTVLITLIMVIIIAVS